MSIARVVASIVAAAIVGWLIWAVSDRYKLAGEVDAHKACLVAIAKPDAVLTPCEKAIADKVDQARHADVCEQALTDSNAFAIRAACSEQVKRVVDDRDAKASDLGDANQQLSGAATRLNQAVDRAEARALTTTQRKADDDRIIQTAPRDAAGRMQCDAQCLQRLAGDPAQGGAGPH